MALDQNQEQDFLGKMFMRLDLGNRSAGQFFTPYHVCELMAEVVATNALEKIEQYASEVYSPLPPPMFAARDSATVKDCPITPAPC